MSEDPFLRLVKLKGQGALERFETASQTLREALALVNTNDMTALLQGVQMVTQARDIAAEGVRLLDEILTLGRPLPKRKRRR